MKLEMDVTVFRQESGVMEVFGAANMRGATNGYLLAAIGDTLGVCVLVRGQP